MPKKNVDLCTLGGLLRIKGTHDYIIHITKNLQVLV